MFQTCNLSTLFQKRVSEPKKWQIFDFSSRYGFACRRFCCMKSRIWFSCASENWLEGMPKMVFENCGAFDWTCASVTVLTIGSRKSEMSANVRTNSLSCCSVTVWMLPVECTCRIKSSPSVLVPYGTIMEIAPEEFFPIWLERRSTLPLNLKYRLRLLFSIVAPYSSATLVMKRSIFSNVVGCCFVDGVWGGFRLGEYVCCIIF